MATLKIIDRGDIPAEKLTGSWAGAFGQTQFMPSSFLRLAVAGTDGRRDIVDSADAALASTAHYFAKSGWRPGVPWGFEVKLPAGLFRPFGAEGEAADVGMGGAGHHPRRRKIARRGRGGAAAACRSERAGLPGDAQLRRRLFLQRRRILFAGRLRARRSPRRRPRHRHPLADRRPGPVARGTAGIADPAHQARLRRRRAGRGDRNTRPSRRSPTSSRSRACR